MSCISLRALVKDIGCLSFLGAYQLTLISMTFVLYGNQSLVLLCNALFTVGIREVSHHPYPTEYWSNTGMGASAEEWALSYIYLWHRHCGHVVVLITIILVQCHNLLILYPKAITSHKQSQFPSVLTVEGPKLGHQLQYWHRGKYHLLIWQSTMYFISHAVSEVVMHPGPMQSARSNNILNEVVPAIIHPWTAVSTKFRSSPMETVC